MSLTDLEFLGQLDVPDLAPARMLNEFCYCPRLAYLEWVQAEFADNLDTLQGRFDHRRLDDAESTPLPEPPLEPTSKPLFPAGTPPLPPPLLSRFMPAVCSFPLQRNA